MKKSNTHNKILLVGASSLLGKAVSKECIGKYQIVGTVNSSNKNELEKSPILIENLDITNESQVEALFFKHKFHAVIHAAALSNIDVCEAKRKLAFDINVIGTSNIAKECRKHNIKMIFVSSSAVFDGQNPPYFETDNICPVNFYGETKVKAENIVLKTSVKNAVVRIPLMYGWNYSCQRNNILTWILQEMQQNKPVFLAKSRYTNPVFNEDVAKSIIAIIEKDHNGVFHIGGSEIINRFEMGRIIAEAFNLNKQLVIPIKNDNNVYKSCNEYVDTSKMKEILKIEPLSMREVVKYMKQELDISEQKSANYKNTI